MVGSPGRRYHRRELTMDAAAAEHGDAIAVGLAHQSAPCAKLIAARPQGYGVAPADESAQLVQPVCRRA